MQLKNDLEGREILKGVVVDYFWSHGGRCATNFLDSEEENFFYAHFLIDARHVMRYSLGTDRRISLGGVGVAIGPHYFPLRNLLSKEMAEYLSIGTTVESIQNNLVILDRFLSDR